MDGFQRLPIFKPDDLNQLAFVKIIEEKEGQTTHTFSDGTREQNVLFT